MAPSVHRFLEVAARRSGQPFEDDTWDDIDASLLTDDEVEAVRLITLVEDHLPAYFDAYSRTFPLEADQDDATFRLHRELYHFIVRWAQEEDAHAYLLARYQVRAGIASQAEIDRDLTTEAKKPFELPFRSHVEVISYTFLQEKFTQLYYQQLASFVAEPTLRRLLKRLAQDEGRHFVFFAGLLGDTIRREGPGVLREIAVVVRDFKMPLAGSIQGYWRKALRATAAVHGLHQLSAFEDLATLAARAGHGPQSCPEFTRAIESRLHQSRPL